MSSIQGLYKSVEAYLVKGATNDTRRFMYEQIMLYLFRGTDQSAIRKLIKEQRIAFDFVGWKATLPTNGSLLVDCKLYLYAFILGLKDTASRVSISIEDTACCKVAARNLKLQELCKTLYDADDYAALNTKEFNTILATVIAHKDLVAFTRSHIDFKLTFIANNYGTTKEELYGDVINQAIIALYKAYPRYGSIGQMLAISKTAVRNRGLNIIEECTSIKSNRMHGTNGESRNNTMSLEHNPEAFEQLLLQESDVLNSSLVTDITGKSGAQSSMFEGLLPVILADDSLTRSDRLFLRLLVGEHSDKFSAFLHCVSNTDICDQTKTDIYRKQLELYLGVTREETNSILDKIKYHFISA
jgi:hypothetical protein